MKIGSYTEVERQSKTLIDLVLPTPETLASGWIYLEAKGADGGRRYFKDGILSDKHYSNGGEGAILGGWVKIKDDEEGCIPSGSTIRFIIGQHGESYCGWYNPAGAGGGGGTGILFLPPNAGIGEWQHLIIAGAGGGAHGDCVNKKQAGGGGHADPDKPSGVAGKGSNPDKAAGWKYGTSGAAELGWWLNAEPGWRPNYGDWADWVKVYGKLNGISVTDDGTVWGVDFSNEIYRRKATDSVWENVPGTFKQVCVATDGTVWGINSDNKSYRLKEDNGGWEFVASIPLKQ
ncbi:MAG: hypothetical protein GY746_07630, partial [Gammaproteobacteria bacterium]|nr:hypothetical protein [Gammaproteobacteria bacterium]